MRDTKVTIQDGIGIFATDTVYGIGCAMRPNNPALKEIYALKQRPLTQKLPLLAPSPEAAFALASNLEEQAYFLANTFWPGALTLIVEAAKTVPPEYKASDNSIAIRVPNAQALLTLMQENATILANTSANLHGQPEALSFQEVPDALMHAALWIYDAGPLLPSKPSTIVDVRKSAQSVKIVRQGAITSQQIKEALNQCE